MAITKFTQQKDDSFDDNQRLMCSVHGCPNRWSVHMEGEKPKCSKHQWEKNSSDYKRPLNVKPEFQSVQQWYEKENF
jgi:protoheme ferro-lyase